MGSETMGSYGMKSARLHTKGFTLIASLLMLLLLSGIAIGLMMMVNTEGKVGGTDLRNDVAFHAAEGGIETMYSNLALVFQNSQAPTPTQICNVGNTPPVLAGFTFVNYSVMPGSTTSTTCPSTLTATWGQISGSGPNAGLWAQIIPVNMLATASSTLGGQEVSMTRQAQVALIPVFQFGVFSESDLSFFSGPNFDMVGPIHTNGDLYPFVGPGSNLTFHNKVSAYGNVVRTQLANGWNANTGYNGNVYMPNATNGCSTTTTNCVLMDGPSTNYGNGSVTAAGSSTAQNGGTYNGSGANGWTNWSTNTVALQVTNGNYGSKVAGYVGTGAKDLKMPFVSGTTFPFQIIRRPPVGESPTSALAQSREWNLASIHVELSDDPTEFLNGTGYSDVNNVRLANITTTQAGIVGGSAANPYGITLGVGGYATTGPNAFTAPASGSTYNLYFAAASNAIPSAGVVLASATTAANGIDGADWPYAPLPWLGNATNGSPTQQGLQPTGTTGAQSAPITYNNTGGTVPALVLCPPATPNGTLKSIADGYPAGCTNPPVSPYYTVNGAAVANNSGAVTAQTQTWNLIDGYLRVEYKDNSGNWHPVTNEWLALGFARGPNAPTQSGGGTPATSPDFTPTPNPINPNAILLLQEPADRGTVTSGLPAYNQLATGLAPQCLATSGTSPNITCTEWDATPPLLVDNATTNPYWQFALTPASPTGPQSVTQFNWYPINFYDTREGEVRDNARAANDNSCTTMGVMNAVEIDVGNLQRWLTGATGTSGTSVNYSSQNGYVLFFSDRRGMLLNPNATTPTPANAKSGDSGLEDVVNASSAAGTPDGVLEPIPAGRSLSPEDVNEDNALDTFGTANLGLGFWGTQGSATTNLNTQIQSTAVPDPFGTAANARIASCSHTARKNWVSGARHVLRLVDASLGNVPAVPGGTIADPGGFTVASENPVYVWGDYNTNSTDTAWNNPLVDEAGHSSSAVIADAVTFLSNDWVDLPSFGMGATNPASVPEFSATGGDNTVTNVGTNRQASTAWYRLAVAGGKNINFPQPTWGAAQDFGTDGGVHNFLRYLENWNGTLNYMGSIVSLYYSTYNTGVYKCCTVVYNPPTRNYIFDLDFSSPQGLPPGTPMFRDVNSLGFREMLTTRTD
ncbi:MAG TPA: hypothetical protein VIX14_16040 [Terriglobales bacterium]